jgi:hypothetical protein
VVFPEENASHGGLVYRIEVYFRGRADRKAVFFIS